MDAVSFISALIVHFPVKFDDPHKERDWTLSIVRELRGFDGAVLEKAVETIVRTRKDRRFPLLAECRAACLDAKRWVDTEKRSRQLASLAEPEAAEIWSIDRIKWADVILGSPIGKRAAKEGWISALQSFLRDLGRAPNDAEIAALKRSVKEFHTIREQLHRGMAGGPGQRAVLIKWSDDIVARQKKLEARFG